ncbi:hypothetical protein AB4Y85_01250 [Microvirga sp. 2YAF29]|uniref:hypothetical protein n=1 Tax=Microvirga sp. 2YAF29 TaxID=3233031 RepID=UPI003F973DDF
MHFRLRLSWLEIILQSLLAFVLFGLVYDFIQAIGASACSDRPIQPDCYPWGAEGLTDNYDSKEAYLRSSAVGIALLFAASIQPFFAPGPKSGLIRLSVVIVAGGLLLRFW